MTAPATEKPPPPHRGSPPPRWPTPNISKGGHRQTPPCPPLALRAARQDLARIRILARHVFPTCRFGRAAITVRGQVQLCGHFRKPARRSGGVRVTTKNGHHHTSCDSRFTSGCVLVSRQPNSN